MKALPPLICLLILAGCASSGGRSSVLAAPDAFLSGAAARGPIEAAEYRWTAPDETELPGLETVEIRELPPAAGEALEPSMLRIEEPAEGGVWYGDAGYPGWGWGGWRPDDCEDGDGGGPGPHEGRRPGAERKRRAPPDSALSDGPRPGRAAGSRGGSSRSGGARGGTRPARPRR